MELAGLARPLQRGKVDPGDLDDGLGAGGDAELAQHLRHMRLEPQEMKDLAHVIIERKAGHFKPEEFTDRYEDAVVELIRAKQAGMPAKVAPEGGFLGFGGGDGVGRRLAREERRHRADFAGTKPATVGETAS